MLTIVDRFFGHAFVQDYHQRNQMSTFFLDCMDLQVETPKVGAFGYEGTVAESQSKAYQILPALKLKHNFLQLNSVNQLDLGYHF